MGYNSSGNASRWECSAPSALAAGAAAVIDADALLQNASLTGSASRRSNNTIELTHTRGYNHVGSLIGDPPLSSETAGSSNVMVEFELLVGRGTGGDGFSVSLAPVHSRVANYDERGVAEGLALSFRSIAGLLFVQFRGEQLLERRLDGRSTFECDHYNCANCAQSSRCLMAGCEWIDWQGRCTAGLEQKRRHTFRTHSFVPVRVLVVDERLSVWHDGHAYVSGLHIPNWEALSRAAPWHVVFGARVSIHVDDHWIRSLRVSQGAVVGSAPTRLSVADDTCNQSGLQYEYYASPIVSHLGQLQGPLNGGTRVQVFGDHLGRGTQRQVCRFGASKVSASRGLDGTLECDSPSFGSPGVVTVEVSLNGVDSPRPAGGGCPPGRCVAVEYSTPMSQEKRARRAVAIAAPILAALAYIYLQRRRYLQRSAKYVSAAGGEWQKPSLREALRWQNESQVRPRYNGVERERAEQNERARWQNESQVRPCRPRPRGTTEWNERERWQNERQVRPRASPGGAGAGRARARGPCGARRRLRVARI